MGEKLEEDELSRREIGKVKSVKKAEQFVNQQSSNANIPISQ